MRGLDIKGKKVLVRVDFNVPLDDQGKVADDTRIKATLTTIRYLLEQGARVILISHLGRPKGKVVEKLRLDDVARRLGELLGREIKKVNDCIGPEAAKAAEELKEGEVLLLENLRFHPEEEKNDPGFAKELASFAEVYINDAFGTAHRAHASTAGVADYLPAAAGFLMEKEIKALGSILSDPDRPFLAVLGGAKVADKIGVLKSLVGKVDAILLGGGMANTFLKAKGSELGDSLVDDQNLEFARKFLDMAAERGVRVELPVDLVIASGDQDPVQVVDSGSVPSGWRALDIGPRTADLYAQLIKEAKTAFWNGPMGVFEEDQFAHGSEMVARALSEEGLISVVGGGDSLAVLEKYGLGGQVTHASTGGGASLEFLEGRELPGVAVLMK
ncbi:MAG: phosphoglycerate kinase [Syntrophaceticus schinkii]|jgi:phosphoglycerate kinase|nr:phosphoglycerate kinase [Syntrophaceticus schinkii]MDD4675033.1 phosphoglycerate kinase [Syntrophaceticus schinkii]